jgi:hypothetical protein
MQGRQAEQKEEAGEACRYSRIEEGVRDCSRSWRGRIYQEEPVVGKVSNCQ